MAKKTSSKKSNVIKMETPKEVKAIEPISADDPRRQSRIALNVFPMELAFVHVKGDFKEAQLCMRAAEISGVRDGTGGWIESQDILLSQGWLPVKHVDKAAEDVFYDWNDFECNQSPEDAGNGEG